jgi:molybdenum-dependent DNA-binding transcriptional regulator ModE
MPPSRNVLTPEALTMMDVIARTGSFAAAARALGKVPSSLTYSVRQLEDALDVLLFDRRSRQARLTAAGQELLEEGRRLLEQMEAVANRVRRVATGWEAQLSIAIDGILSRPTLLELCEAFYALPAAVDSHATQNGSRANHGSGSAGVLTGGGRSAAQPFRASRRRSMSPRTRGSERGWRRICRSQSLRSRKSFVDSAIAARRYCDHPRRQRLGGRSSRERG